MRQIPACLLAAMTMAVAAHAASAAGRSAWMNAARAGEVPEIPAGGPIPAAEAPPADRSVREDGGRYRVSRLVRSDGSVLPAPSDFRLRLTDEERERFQKIAAHIHHKVPGRKLEFPEPTGYERVTKQYGFQIEGDTRGDGTFDLQAIVLTYFVARPEGLHDYLRIEIAPGGTILSADDPRLARADSRWGRRPPSQQGPQTHALMNDVIDYWNRDWPAF